MWMPIMLFFYMGFEHSIVNMFLFPSGLMLGGDFTLGDYFVWNEIPTVARQPRRRDHVRRADALRHPRQDRAAASPSRGRDDRGGAGGGPGAGQVTRGSAH